MRQTKQMREAVREAQERLDDALGIESIARDRFLQDYRFAMGDSHNEYQWPDIIIKTRNKNRPRLTINKTRLNNLLILNGMKLNRVQIKVSPVGDQATKDAAEIYEGIFRHIEYESNAQEAYDLAAFYMVHGGIGYFRVKTDYVDETAFDQSILIDQLPDPLAVVLDPSIPVGSDGSEAQWAIIFEDLPLDRAKSLYPQVENWKPDVLTTNGWLRKDYVRRAEYYRKSYKRRKLFLMPDGQRIFGDELEPELRKALEEDDTVRWRWTRDESVEWMMIVGNEVVDKTIIPGKYIPIVRMVGEETLIDGQLDRKGHTRYQIDPQRMYNYWTSSAAEAVAMQTKTPWVGPIEAIEELETYWNGANINDYLYLPYKSKDDHGNPIAPPQRMDPPPMPQAYVQGMQIASGELMAVGGQFEAELGQQGNERSGVAIHNRQRQTDVATFHFPDNKAKAIRYAAKVIMSMIPTVYDTPRVMRIMAESGEISQVQIDPQLQQAAMVREGQEVTAALNPQVGRFDVIADVGPAFATRRQEAYQACTEIITARPDLMQIIGDLVFKAADFPMSEQIAERLQNMIPPQALGKAAPPQFQQMQQMLQQQQQTIEQLLRQLHEHQVDKNIDSYRAETDRIKTVKDLPPPVAAAIIQPIVENAGTAPKEGNR